MTTPTPATTGHTKLPDARIADLHELAASYDRTLARAKRNGTSLDAYREEALLADACTHFANFLESGDSLRQSHARLLEALKLADAALIDAADTFNGFTFRVGFRQDSNISLCDAMASTATEAREAVNKLEKVGTDLRAAIASAQLATPKS